VQLNEELRRDLEEVIRRHGGKIDTVGHPTTTLEDYFLRIVEESKAHPGRRYLPEREAVVGDRAAAPAPAAQDGDKADKSPHIKEKT